MTRKVAAFDFDGTLSTRDTFVPFLRMVAGPGAFLVAVLRSLPHLLVAAVRDRSRDTAKAAMLRCVFAGRDEASVRAIGERHAADVVATQLRPEMHSKLGWHRQQGHEIVIISASPAIYLDAVGRTLGVHAVLSTRLAVDDDGRLTGEIDGRNVRRDAKVRRLDAWLARDDAEIWAYGDSTGDRELLARADHPTRV